MPCLSAKPFVPFLFCVSFSTTVAESDLALLTPLILTAELDLLMKISEVNCSPEKRQAWKRPVTVRYKDTAPNLRCPLTPKDVGGLGEQRRGPASWAEAESTRPASGRYSCFSYEKQKYKKEPGIACPSSFTEV